MNSDFTKAQAEFIDAKARLDEIIIERAREIYEHYGSYTYDDDGAGGGYMTKVECHKTALATLEKGQTAEEYLAEVEANRKYMRTVYIPFKIESYLRNARFHFNKSRDDIAEEALSDYLTNATTIPNVEEPDSLNGKIGSVGLKKDTDALLVSVSTKLGCTKGKLIVAALESYFVNHPPKFL